MSFAKTLSLEIQKPSLIRDGAQVALCSILIALCNHVSIFMPFTPVPLIIQDTMILLTAILLGSRKGAATVFCFLAQGAMGLPVFAGGHGGILKFVGPTGGYIVGYLVAAFVAGWIAERVQRKTLLTALLALISGSAIIFSMGAAYLSTFVGLKQSFFLGVLPFIPGNLFKTIVALKILQWIGWNKSSCR